MYLLFIHPRIQSYVLYMCTYVFANYIHTYVCTTDPPMNPPTITVTTTLSSTSFNVSWTTPDPNYSTSYAVTWTNLCTGIIGGSMTVPANTSGHMVTGLNGVDNYNVSVAANNSCGMMMSDAIAVYGKNHVLT